MKHIALSTLDRSSIRYFKSVNKQNKVDQEKLSTGKISKFDKDYVLKKSKADDNKAQINKLNAEVSQLNNEGLTLKKRQITSESFVRLMTEIQEKTNQAANTENSDERSALQDMVEELWKQAKQIATSASNGFESYLSQTSETPTQEASAGAPAAAAAPSSAGSLPGDSYTVINGTSGFDFIFATADAEAIYAGATGDSILAQDGDDFVFGEDGGDTVYAGSGNDVVIGGGASDTGSDELINGDNGNDILYANNGNNATLDGGEDDDILYMGQGLDQSGNGGNGNDIIIGGNFAAHLNQLLDGSGGNDLIIGASTSGYMAGALYGGDGDDILVVRNSQTGSIVGGAGNDIIFMGSTSTHTFAGEGDDIIVTSSNADSSVDAEDGNDLIYQTDLTSASKVMNMSGGLGVDTLIMKRNYADHSFNATKTTVNVTATGDRYVINNHLNYLQFQDGYIDLDAGDYVFHAGLAPTLDNVSQLTPPDWHDATVNGEDIDDFLANIDTNKPTAAPATVPVPSDPVFELIVAGETAGTNGFGSVEETPPEEETGGGDGSGGTSTPKPSTTENNINPLIDSGFDGPTGDWSSDQDVIEEQLAAVEKALSKAKTYEAEVANDVTIYEAKVTQTTSQLNRYQSHSEELMSVDTNETAVKVRAAQSRLQLAFASSSIVSGGYQQSLLSLFG